MDLYILYKILKILLCVAIGITANLLVRYFRRKKLEKRLNDIMNNRFSTSNILIHTVQKEDNTFDIRIYTEQFVDESDDESTSIRRDLQERQIEDNQLLCEHSEYYEGTSK